MIIDRYWQNQNVLLLLHLFVKTDCHNMIKRILPYLILPLCMFLCMQNISESKNDKNLSDLQDLTTIQLSSDSFSFTEADSELNIPRPTSVSNTPRANIQIKRPGSAGNSGYTLIKSGKLFNRNTTHSFQNDILLFPSGFSDHDHHLINLGKLII